MAGKIHKRIVLLSFVEIVLVLALCGWGFAGTVSVGFVAGAVQTVVNGRAPLPNSVLFPGDSLQVCNGAAVVVLRGGSRLVLGRDTTASFPDLAQLNAAISLEGGQLSLYHPQGVPSLRVMAGGLSVVLAGEFPTLGEVSLVQGVLHVRAKEGRLRVEGQGLPVEVAQGKTIVVQTKTAQAQTPGTAGHGSRAGARLSSQATMGIFSLGTGGLSVAMSAVAMSRAGSAKDAADAANASAQNALTTANSSIAGSEQVEVTAVALGCAINTLAAGSGATSASPFTPPSGFTCP